MLTYYPGAKVRPVLNHGGGLLSLLGWVVHVQVGYGSLFGWFDNPESEVSSHLWVSQGGEVEQYVAFDEQSWAQMAGNADYLSIETEGEPGVLLSAAQCSALSEIFAWGHTYLGTGLALVDHGKPGITTHAHYPSGLADDSWGGHICPGLLRTRQLPGIVANAQALCLPHPPTG